MEQQDTTEWMIEEDFIDDDIDVKDYQKENLS